MSTAFPGLKFIQPSASANKQHILGFSTSRAENDVMFEVWNDNTGSDVGLRVVAGAAAAPAKITRGLWQGTKVGEVYGGTNQTTYAAGDILYASAADTLSKRSATTNGHILTLVAGLPAWAANAQAVFSGAKVYKTATQAGPGNDTEYTVTWDAEKHDVGGYHDNVTNNSRLTVLTTGYHRIYSGLCLENFSTTNAIKLRFRVDGTTYLEGEGNEYGSATGSGVFAYTEEYLTAGQYVEVRTQCAGNITGGAGKSWFGISWGGA